MPLNDQQRELYATAVHGGCEAAKQNWIAARAYLETAYNAGLVSPVCYRWLCETYLASGQLEIAEAILEAWRESDPRSKDVRDYRQRLQAAVQAKNEGTTRRIDSAVSDGKPAPIAVRSNEILPLHGDGKVGSRKKS
jgi:thioredoxin-like negative regulator of GroEL